MGLIALALTVGWAVSVFAFAGLLRSMQRAHARREDLLVNQLLHAAGRTWQPAPAAEEREPQIPWADREYQPRFSASPEQLPVQ